MTVTCGDIRAHIDPAQAKELEYLARWHADLQYIKERFGADTGTQKKLVFLYDCRKAIKTL